MTEAYRRHVLLKTIVTQVQSTPLRTAGLPEEKDLLFATPFPATKSTSGIQHGRRKRVAQRERRTAASQGTSTTASTTAAIVQTDGQGPMTGHQKRKPRLFSSPERSCRCRCSRPKPKFTRLLRYEKPPGDRRWTWDNRLWRPTGPREIGEERARTAAGDGCLSAGGALCDGLGSAPIVNAKGDVQFTRSMQQYRGQGSRATPPRPESCQCRPQTQECERTLRRLPAIPV